MTTNIEDIDPVSGLTDRDAFELLVKYGGEKSVILTQEMLHVGGEEMTVRNILISYEKNGGVAEPVKQMIRQGVRYIKQQMETPKN